MSVDDITMINQNATLFWGYKLLRIVKNLLVNIMSANMLILQRMNSLNIHVNHHPLLWQKLRSEYKHIIYVQNEACSWKDLNLLWPSDWTRRPKQKTKYWNNRSKFEQNMLNSCHSDWKRSIYSNRTISRFGLVKNLHYTAI